jgi:hypothetical protein
MVAGLPKVDRCRASGAVAPFRPAFRWTTPISKRPTSRASVGIIHKTAVWHPLRVVRADQPHRGGAASAQVGSGGGSAIRPLPASEAMAERGSVSTREGGT